MSRQLPAIGDVLVSNPSATVEHQICIVPRPPHHWCANHATAVVDGRALALELGVDLWLTQDNIHFLQLVSFRPQAAPAVEV